MGQIAVYLKPFDDDGNYADWIDISDSVSARSIGDISVSLDGSPFQLGVFTFSNITLRLNNVGGEFSDIDIVQSYFRYRRGDSQIKITWRGGDLPICGQAVCGKAVLHEEIELYKGLVSDEGFSTDVLTQEASVTVLGFESLFARTIVPFDTVSALDSVQETIFNILNISQITDILTVDIDNILPNLDQNIDSLASLQNKTVKQGLESLLTCSNSVLYILDDTIYVAPRTPTADVQATFYGAASPNGPENIEKITDLRNGVSRVYNFINWRNSTAAVTDSDSATRYGTKKKELDFDIYTDATKISNILNSILDEFGEAKQEFDLTVPLNYDNLQLALLDRVIVDFPTVHLAGDSDLPICGIAVWDEFTLPNALWAFSIDTDEPYKIISRKVHCQKQNVTFRMRRI